MIIFWINCFCLIAGTGFLLFFAFMSQREGEKRALWIAVLLMPANALFWTLLIVFGHHAALRAANVAILGLAAVFALLSL
jgi:hypothetical protein